MLLINNYLIIVINKSNYTLKLHLYTSHKSFSHVILTYTSEKHNIQKKSLIILHLDFYQVLFYH